MLLYIASMILNEGAQYHLFYLFPYTLFLLTNCLVLVFTRAKRFRKDASIEYYKHVEELVAVYVSWILILSLVVSLLDYIYYQHSIVFPIAALICTSFFIIRIRFFIASYILAIISFGLNCFNIPENLQHYGFEMLLLVIIIPISTIVAHLNYRDFVDSYLKQKYLCHETKRANTLANDLAKANAELKRLSYTDELTNIPNRRGYQKYITDLKQRKLPYALTVIMLDIDYFKNYNDYYGHLYGDMVLSRVSDVLRKVAISTHCFTARWGGEEFILLAPEKKPEEIITIYKNILKEIHKYEIVNVASDISNTITFSIGAYYGEVKSQDDIQVFLHKADSLLYEIKESGRNGFALMKGKEILYKYQPNADLKKP